MTWTICDSGAAKGAAGANVNTAIITSSSDLMDAWSDEAENMVCAIARYDVITNWATLTANGKEIMQDLCASHIAQKIIGYEPEAIGNNAATLRLNILENNINTIKGLIKDDKNKTYLGIS